MTSQTLISWIPIPYNIEPKYKLYVASEALLVKRGYGTLLELERRGKGFVHVPTPKNVWTSYVRAHFMRNINQILYQSINQWRWRMQAPMCLYIRIIHSTLYSYSNQPNNYFYTQIGLQFRQDQLCNQKQYLYGDLTDEENFYRVDHVRPLPWRKLSRMLTRRRAICGIYPSCHSTLTWLAVHNKIFVPNLCQKMTNRLIKTTQKLKGHDSTRHHSTQCLANNYKICLLI